MSPSVRIAAADALCRLGRRDEALPVLARALQHENEWVKVQALNALDDLGSGAAPVREAIQALSADKGEYVKRLVEHLSKTLQLK